MQRSETAAAVARRGAPARRLALAAVLSVVAAPAGGERRVPLATGAVRIDGLLDEAVWSNALVVELPYEIDPGENTPARVRTECLMAAGADRLYVGFRAVDPEPGAIRAHYFDRDAAWDDDWVLLELDTFGDQRRAFEFLVNPLGVQMDDVLNEVGGAGTTIDNTWDAIWESAGRVTAEGYSVEIAVPFAALRFPGGGGEQRWGFQALRHYPRRFSYFFRTAAWDRNRGCTLCENLSMLVAGASPGKAVEVSPTLTTSRTDRRNEALSPLRRGAIDASPGLSLRFGPRPGLSLNAALDPDFSQVEADAAQLDVNVRFALYYPEKRPFFLEGADLFKTPLQAAYSRAIADPVWAVKAAGKEGRNAFAAVVAEDDRTNLLLPANQTSSLSSLDVRSFSTILRYRRDVGARSTVGALVTDRRGRGYSSTLAGVDGVLRPSLKHSVAFQLLGSRTAYPEAFALAEGQSQGARSDWAGRVAWRYESRDWNGSAAYESLGRGFRADAGFLPRVDVRTASAAVQRVVWPGPGQWFSRLGFAVEGSRSDDQSGRLTDAALDLRVDVNGPYRSVLSGVLEASREVYAGTAYDRRSGRLDLTIRPGASLAGTFALKAGDAIDYAGRRPARLLRLDPGVVLFAGRHVQAKLDHSLERLTVTGGRLYTVNLSQARLVYQLDARAFVRAVLQYRVLDRSPALFTEVVAPRSSHLFMQWLFSYKLNPQTVVFLGYSDNRDADDSAALGLRDRTFLVKLGYAWLP